MKEGQPYQDRIFVHIPKNGGMTIRKGLYRHDDAHFGIHLGQTHNLLGDAYVQELGQTMNQAGFRAKGYEHARWRDFRKSLRDTIPAFSIVRNPWSRTASRYTFAVKIGIESGKKSFREFLSERHEYADKPFFWHRAVHGWYQQKDYVVDEDGQLRCDILRTECLTDEIERYFDFRYEVVHNVSDTGRKMLGIEDWRELYGKEEYDIVADWHKEDIDFFGFTFDTPASKNLTRP